MKDLFWDEKTSTLKPRETKALRTFRLMIAKNVPLPAEGVQVLCRYVTICLFDGKSVSGVVCFENKLTRSSLEPVRNSLAYIFSC